MKKIVYIFLCIALFSGCNKFLDEPMKGDYSSSNIYTTVKQATYALNAVYNGATYSVNLWKFGDVPSDDSVKGGNDGDQPDLVYLDDWTASADNGAIALFWQNTYETISRANNVIDGVEKASFSQEVKDKLLGQARFLRAYSYFQLVNIFGSVPLKTKPQVTGENIHVGFSSPSDIYVQIEQDLSFASDVLPAVQTEAGRVTKGAALGLLAKAQLYQRKYTEALESISSLKALGLYELDEYENLFRLGNENSTESIFAIRFLSDEIPFLGNCLNQYFAPAEEGGYYFNAPTEDWVACFDDPEDLRIDLTIGREGKDWLNDDSFSAAWAPATGFLVRKHNQPLSEVPKGRKGDGGLAYIYLRYADILLMEAECQVELGHPELAKEPFNEVRQRAGVGEKTGLSQTEMREAVRNERRMELGFEFHRFFDLMRWGETAAKAALGEDFPWTEGGFHFPVPQSELDANQALQ